MPDIPKYDIGLTGINAFGNSQAIQPTMYGNGFPLEQGFHLRWQLRSGLGLPARFLIYKTNEKFNRDTNTPDELDPSVWKTEAQQIALLQAEINALNEAGGQGTKYTYPTFTLHYGYWDALEWLTDALQTRGVTPSTQIAALIQKYRNSSTVLELNSLIGNLQRDIRNGQQIGNHRIYTMNQQVIEQDNRRSFRTSLKRMDTLNLAALDPYIARMAGFYFIDRDNMPFRGGSRTGYFVVADYEGQEYPFNTVIPKREAPIFNLASEMRFEGFKAIPMGGAYLCFSDAAPNNLGFLTTLSGAKPSIRIIFDEPEGIQEAIFTVKAVGASASDFWVSPNLYSTVEPTGGDIWKITVFDPNGLITPHGESRPSFKSVDIKVSNTRALIFQKVQFKYKVGQIGFIKSNPIILGGGVGEEKIQPLSLGRALAEPATPILNEQGVYEPFTANVKLSLINKAQSINPEKPNVIAANSSVRAIFELTNLNNLAVKESDITVIRGHNRVLPELLFYAPLASTAKDYATGQPLALFGKSRFVRDNPLEKKHSSLLIADNGGAYASEGVAFSVNEAFTIDLWVKIKEGNPLNEYIPWVSFGGERGVSFGFRQTTNSYTLQLKVGSETSETLPNTITPQFLNHWFRLYVSFINGRVAFNGVLIERALNVNVIPLTMGGIAIGMDFNAETQQRIRSFKGQICHVKIWNQVITIPQADYLLREYADAFPQQLIPKSLYRLKEVLSFNDTLPTYQRFIYGINTLNAGFSMQFWLYIANDESALVLCDASTSFRFGVNYMDGGCFWENSKIGFLLNFNRTPIQGQWTHISFSQDANNLFKFYIDGQLVGETLYDKYLMTRIDQPLFFGGEPTGNATLDGKIANFRLYPFPCDPIQTKRAFAVNQFLETNIPETRYKFRAKGIDLFGRISEFGPAMAYQVKSDYKPNPPATLKAQILTFETTLQSASLVTPAQPQKSYWDIQLNPILNFEIGAFLARHIITVSGLKQATTSLTDKTLIQKFVSQKYEVKAVVDNHLRLKDVPFAQLKPNEVRTYQTIPDETTPKSILIEYDSQVKLRWEWTGLQQIFNPGVTDFQIFKNIGLLNDIQVKITGVEGIPDATNRKFRVHTNRILSGDANELNGKICLIDHRAYVITAHTAAGQAASFEVRYDGYPILSPQVDTFFVLTIPETQSDWKDFSKHENWLRDEEVHNNTPSPISIDNYQITSALLTSAELEAMKADKDKIVDWLPAENTWKLRVTNIAKPPNYAENKSSEYVTSALVVYCQTDNPTQGVWNTWYVLWHEWTDSYLDLYITVADQRQNPNINNEEIDEDHPKPISSYAPLNPTKLLVEGGQMRFYQGKSFNPKVGINPPTDSDQAMLSYHFAVASKTERGLGALSVKASVVAVNRQMPLEPHAPIIESIGLADVQGNSEARIFWQNTEGVYGYNLYRATDTAIFDKDLDNRRLAIGHYKMDNKAQIFIDDLDFEEFLRAVRHKDPTLFAPDFQRFIGKSLSTIEPNDLCGKDKYSDAWNALTPIWQYWADRFYPACNTVERDAIANRNGNETAFTLVNTEPIRKEKYSDPSRLTTHVLYPDTVNGVVSNSYFYRLRTVGHNMALGSSWSPVSNGLGVSVPTSRPRTPVWTKVEAGDRQVTLQWALNREPDFNEYILYRATNEHLLNDVRWAEVEQPEGLVIRRIADPRILTDINATNGNSIIKFREGQTPPPIASILGIYRAFEFDAKIQGEQVGAMNLLQPSTRIVGNTIQNIRKVAKNTEGVIVWRNTEGVVQVMTAFGEYPVIDRGLRGRTQYAYKIEACSSKNTKSNISEINRVSVHSISKPVVPNFTLLRVSNNENDIIRISCNQPQIENYLDIYVEKQIENDRNWSRFRSWTALTTPFSLEDTINTEDVVYYKITVKFRYEGLLSENPIILFSEPYFN